MRRFDELTREEQVTAVKNCERLYERINDYCTGYYSPAYCRVEEILYDFPTDGGHYSIDGAYGGFVNLGYNYQAIAEYLEKIEHDFCEVDAFLCNNNFHDITTAAELLAKFRKYAELLHEDDYGYINCGDKNRDYMFNFCYDLKVEMETWLLELCNGEYEYFEDLGNCIDYCEEMEYFDTDNIYVTDDLKIIDLEEIQDVLKDNHYHLDISTIANILEEIDERINA